MRGNRFAIFLLLGAPVCFAGDDFGHATHVPAMVVCGYGARPNPLSAQEAAVQDLNGKLSPPEIVVDGPYDNNSHVASKLSIASPFKISLPTFTTTPPDEKLTWMRDYKVAACVTVSKH